MILSRAQHFNVQLPQDFRCRDCTLRLVRKASEWGEGYQFFSCADVDILPRQEYREDCSGHGRILPGRPLICRCDRLYSGPRCQNKEECIDDRDCGSHGKCIEIESTTSPGKQCYCEAGWFGPGCASKSPIKNGRIDHDAYQKRKLHDDLTLYWRTIKDGEEIEFALIAKGTSYVALGWRPADLDESCRKFPEISGSTGSFEEPLKTTTITSIDNKSATNNATESPTDIKQTTEEMGIGDIADNFRSLGQSDQDGLGDDDVFVNSSESDKNNGSTYTKSGTISTITPLGDNTGEAPRSSSIKAETEPIIISSLPASTVSSSTLLVTVPSNTEKVLTSTSKTGSEKSSPAPSTATSLSLDKDSEEEAPSNSKNEKNSEEEEEDNYSPLEEVESPKDSKSVTNGEDAVEEEEYEVTEYYDEYDASINSQVVPEEVNDIPGGLLSLTPHSTRIATFSPASFQNTPKMETDGWRPITRPTMAPLLNRLPVSEVVPVDTRPSTSEPESTRRLTGLDRLRQKLSSRAAAAATESTLGRRVSNLNSDELMAPDERQSFEQLFRKRRSTDLDRKQSGFAVPLDDASEEEVEYANNFDHSIHGPKNDFVAKEVEPKPEPNDSEHDHHDHHQEHGEKPLTNFTEDALPEPVPEPQPEPNLQSKGNSKPELGGDNADEVDWTPRGPLHPMDCTDIVIGMARGSLSRINDFYTRDRSTPRVDTYFGGRNDLTGAFAEEKEDVTTFIFRRKTNASEPTDHSILPGKMHVIWSKGQEPGQYKHVPKSGLEAGNSSVPDFYKPDELKYHGKENRGVVEIDFFAKADAVTEVIAQENGNISQSEDHNHGHNHSNHSHTEGHKHKTDAFCGGEFKYPNRCNPSGEDCLYYAKWEYREKTDDIAFTVRTNYTNKWVGIGFGQSSAMSETDAVIGWLDSNGRSAVVDTWILGYSHPRIDQLQDARDSKIQILDGKTTMTFTRKRETPDKDQDVQLGDGNCVYFKYPIHGGTFSAVSKRISKHTMTPVVSDNRICIKSCPGFGNYFVSFSLSISFNTLFKEIENGKYGEISRQRSFKRFQQVCMAASRVYNDAELDHRLRMPNEIFEDIQNYKNS
ncbi:hypothetical protein QYM36_002636 [Artemia franciscana]|uniref:Uncharacterized protein n=1 Tax=Artemia franciscana TaxID=6661 RepID=A0AA88I929_ARTSF|nr:hypothetical protein QYM36_002636 [Artemia franciscana]